LFSPVNREQLKRKLPDCFAWKLTILMAMGMLPKAWASAELCKFELLSWILKVLNS
jgi:hypothetical protein